jgi:hypothetical protein
MWHSDVDANLDANLDAIRRKVRTLTNRRDMQLIELGSTLEKLREV